MTRMVDTLIIGASAAGLATAACLKESGQRFEVLEASNVVGQAWRQHYDRLHLHTPKSSSALPGLVVPSEWPRYPTRDQVVDYLERYLVHHRLEPRFGQKVTHLERHDDEWVATTSDEEWRTRSVVIATGANRRPVRPTWPGLSTFRGQVMHSSEYRNGDPWHGRPVLVVGFGNSACEQAIDLVERGSQAHLAVRSPVNVIPRDLFGVVPVLQLGVLMQHLPPAVADALAWPMIRASIGDIRKVGLRKLPYGPNTQIARDRHIPLLDIGTMDHIRAGRIRVHGDIERFTEDGVVFTDGETLVLAALVLATGYSPALDEFLVQWREVCDPNGIPVTSGSPTALPGLYFCGQFVSPAGMLRQIRIEAGRIATHIARA
ncbi:MAG TPA: NAD(P)/FAD-dependent oxidoreductase [Dermatophilaceae bacterium]